MDRRSFLLMSSGMVLGMNLPWMKHATAQPAAASAPFKISLAEWSLNRALFAKKMDPLDFPKIAKRDYEIDCIELVDQFIANKSKDMDYLKELKQRADGEGVHIGLIMLDTNGPLGSPDKARRDTSIDQTLPWIDAAKFLGARTIRVNARGSDDPAVLHAGMVESCARLAEYAAPLGITITIENHGGPSSDPQWLTAVMKEVGKSNFGTLPDFGNFPPETNRYDAVETLMPFAKAVSAKATQFSADGQVTDTDFRRMMRIVRDGGYSGYVGVESAPSAAEDEPNAIRITRDTLRTILDEQKRCVPLFDGKSLEGWSRIEGGEWTVEEGVLIGRNGKNWSTDPEKTGSWLRTHQEYGDFRLELQYAINEGGNSGVFFRSTLEKNPAFTGYEMQIVDAFGQPPSKQSATAIYDVVAPTKNLVRPAGQWNTVTILARGPKITFEMNGETVLEAELNRSARGYIGLQNHDAHAVVKFRNIRIEAL